MGGNWPLEMEVESVEEKVRTFSRLSRSRGWSWKRGSDPIIVRREWALGPERDRTVKMALKGWSEATRAFVIARPRPPVAPVKTIVPVQSIVAR